MKQNSMRSFYMPKATTIFFPAFICIGSFAQKSEATLEKAGLKNLLKQLSYVPTKSFTSLSYTGKDSVSFYGPKIASVSAFYISKTEVMNEEYRKFTEYVKDSIAHTLLQHFQNATNNVDWNQKIDWKDSRLESMMISPDERIYSRPEIDVEKIKYEIDFFGTKESISIYPDTLVWIRDFSYSYNEPLAKRYFRHPSYNDYPVVGISLKQAMAFCQWKTDQLQKHLAAEYNVTIRLPISNEWESAAVDIKESGNLFSKNNKYNCNFGPITGMAGVLEKDFKDDGYFYTSPVKNYPAGPFQLYDIKGNVSEWTSTSRDDIAGMEIKADKQKASFVVKGGGWNSTPFYLQAGVCQFFNPDAANSFIGFRYVVNVTKKL